MPVLYKWGVLVVIAALITAIVSYSVWSLVITSDNQRRFEDQVRTNVSDYQRSLAQHALRLTNPLTGIVSRIPLSVFEQSQEQLATWVDANQAQWLQQLPDALTVNVLSLEQIKVQTGASLSFIVIDMLNRIEQGEPAWLEAVKSSDGKWHLHKVEPILGEYGVMQGVLHVTYSLKGVRKIFSGNPQHAKVVLRQYIDNHPPLTFYSNGSGTRKYPQKVVNISDSYWQLMYQPSEALLKATAYTPLWFWLMVVLLPLVMMSVGALLIHRSAASPTPVSAVHKTKKKKLSKQVEEKPEEEMDELEKAPAKVVQEDELPLDKKNESTKPADDTLTLPEHIFRAYDIRGIANTEFTEQLAYAVGQALATEVLATGDKAMIVGRDARTHSESLARAMIEGITYTGCHVYDIGLVPTPLMNFSACQHPRTSSGVIITASHNPAAYNGCKMVVNGATLVDEDIQRLKQKILKGDFAVGESVGQVEEHDFSQQYINHVTSDVAVMDGWRIVIDAGNGAASELAPRLMEAFSCKVIPLFCEFDGTFPNHDPDPSNINNLSPLIATVTAKDADIGFAFDGDGDRLMVVTRQGRVIWPDQLLMLFAQDIVARHPGSDVVFDIKSTHLLSRVISEHGGRPVMWKTGHSHIKSKMKQTKALLGGEFSGHIFFKERWFGFDDGLYAAVRLLEILTLTGQTIDQLLDSLPVSVSTPEIKISVDENNKFALVEKLAQSPILASGKHTTIDGVRVDYADGWGLVRASNTAAALTLRFEAKDEQTLNEIKNTFNTALHTLGLSIPESAN